MLADYVTYNRSEKAYEFVTEDGPVCRFPSGPAGKAEAIRFVAEYEFADVWEVVQRTLADNPHLERVLFKGMDILIGGGVEAYAEPLPGNVVGHVVASDGMGRYAITTGEGGYLACQCPHFEGDAPYAHEALQKTCKHIAAFKLWILTECPW